MAHIENQRSSDSKPSFFGKIFSGIRNIFSSKKQAEEVLVSAEMLKSNAQQMREILHIDPAEAAGPWLESLYTYLYSGPDRLLDKELADTAVAMLRAVIGTDVHLGVQLETAIRQHQVEYRTSDKDLGFFGRLKRKITAPIQKLRDKWSFEQLLKKIKTETRKGPTITELLAFRNDRTAGERMYKHVEVPADFDLESREIVERARNISVSKSELIDRLIQLVIEQGDGQTKQLQDSIATFKNRFQKVLQGGTSHQAAEVLGENEVLLRQLASGEQVEFLYSLNRIRKPQYWRQQKALIATQISHLLDPESVRALMYNNLLRRGVLLPDTLQQISGLTGYATTFSRATLVQQECDSAGYEQEKTKAVLRTSLADLSGSAISPAIIEDIVEARISPEDLMGYISLDWLVNTEKFSANEKVEYTSRIDELLRKVLRSVSAAATMALAVPLSIFTAAKTAAEMAAGLLSFRKKSKNDVFDFSKSFAGDKPSPEAPGWLLHGFENTGKSRLFRAKSSANFNWRKASWESDTITATVGSDSERVADSNRITLGSLSGSVTAPKSGFCPVLLPYDAVPSQIIFGAKNNQSLSHTYYFDRLSDGSYGFDLDIKQREVNGKMIPRDFSEIFEESGNTSTAYLQDNTPAIERFPFPDTQKLLEPIIPDESWLPADIQGLLSSLRAQDISQKMRADIVCKYISDNWIYSLDPQNERVFDVARKKGQRAFIEAMFSHRKVKCDGAATIAIGLLRLLGIESRLAIGVIAGPDVAKINAGDAHGWVECRIDGKLETFDPTPFMSDLYTITAESRVNWLMKFLEFFKKEKKMTYIDFEQKSGAANVRIQRMFQKVGLKPNSLSPITFLKYKYPFDLPRLEAKEVVAKMLLDEQALLTIEEMQKNKRMTCDELIEQLDSRKIVSEEKIRSVMLERNANYMLRQSTEYFFDTVFTRAGLTGVSKEFMEKWYEQIWMREGSLKSNFANGMSTWILRKVRENAEFRDNPNLLRNEHGEYSDDLITFLQELLHRWWKNYYNQYSFNVERMQAEYEIAVKQELGKVLPLMTKDAIKASGMLEICQSLLFAEKALRDSKK